MHVPHACLAATRDRLPTPQPTAGLQPEAAAPQGCVRRSTAGMQCRAGCSCVSNACRDDAHMLMATRHTVMQPPHAPMGLSTDGPGASPRGADTGRSTGRAQSGTCWAAARRRWGLARGQSMPQIGRLARPGLRAQHAGPLVLVTCMRTGPSTPVRMQPASSVAYEAKMGEGQLHSQRMAELAWLTLPG